MVVVLVVYFPFDEYSTTFLLDHKFSWSKNEEEVRYCYCFDVVFLEVKIQRTLRKSCHKAK